MDFYGNTGDAGQYKKIFSDHVEIQIPEWIAWGTDTEVRSHLLGFCPWLILPKGRRYGAGPNGWSAKASSLDTVRQTETVTFQYSSEAPLGTP